MFPNSFLLSLATDKQVSPKSGTLKSPPKGFDTSAISKTYYNLVRTQLNQLFEISHFPFFLLPVSPFSTNIMLKF